MSYAWIIDTDHLYDPNDDVFVNEAGTIGPRIATNADTNRLAAGEGWHFKIYDDDGILYYTGRLVVSGNTTRDDETAMFGPLVDFGQPNAGAVDIRWAWDHWHSA